MLRQAALRPFRISPTSIRQLSNAPESEGEGFYNEPVTVSVYFIATLRYLFSWTDFLDLLGSLQITNYAVSARSQIQHECVLLPIHYEAESFKGQSPLLYFQDLTLSEMLNWHPNLHRSAFHFHKKIIGIIESQNIHRLRYMKITWNNSFDK